MEARPAFALFSSLRFDPALLAVAHNPEYAHAGWNADRLSPWYMLDLHRDRLARAATHWGWDAAVAAVSGDAGLTRLEQALRVAVDHQTRDTKPGPQRCRIVLDETGRLACDTSAVPDAPLDCLFPPRLLPPDHLAAKIEAGEASPLYPHLRDLVPWEVRLDLNTTTPSVYTHYKTTLREVFDAARLRAGITAGAPGQRREVLLVNAETGAILDGSICTIYLFRGGRWVTPPVPPRYGAKDVVGSGGLDGTTRRWSLERGYAVEEQVYANSLREGEECWLSNGVRGFMRGRISLVPTGSAG